MPKSCLKKSIVFVDRFFETTFAGLIKTPSSLSWRSQAILPSLNDYIGYPSLYWISLYFILFHIFFKFIIFSGKSLFLISKLTVVMIHLLVDSISSISISYDHYNVFSW